MTKKPMKHLRGMSPEDLRKRLDELNLVITKGRGNIAIGNPFSRKGGGDTSGAFVAAKREKARILTLLGEREGKG